MKTLRNALTTGQALVSTALLVVGLSGWADRVDPIGARVVWRMADDPDTPPIIPCVIPTHGR